MIPWSQLLYSATASTIGVWLVHYSHVSGTVILVGLATARCVVRSISSTVEKVASCPFSKTGFILDCALYPQEGGHLSSATKLATKASGSAPTQAPGSISTFFLVISSALLCI